MSRIRFNNLLASTDAIIGGHAITGDPASKTRMIWDDKVVWPPEQLGIAAGAPVTDRVTPGPSNCGDDGSALEAFFRALASQHLNGVFLSPEGIGKGPNWSGFGSDQVYPWLVNDHAKTPAAQNDPTKDAQPSPLSAIPSVRVRGKSSGDVQVLSTVGNPAHIMPGGSSHRVLAYPHVISAMMYFHSTNPDGTKWEPPNTWESASPRKGPAFIAGLDNVNDIGHNHGSQGFMRVGIGDHLSVDNWIASPVQVPIDTWFIAVHFDGTIWWREIGATAWNAHVSPHPNVAARGGFGVGDGQCFTTMGWSNVHNGGISDANVSVAGLFSVLNDTRDPGIAQLVMDAWDLWGK